MPVKRTIALVAIALSSTALAFGIAAAPSLPRAGVPIAAAQAPSPAGGSRITPGDRVYVADQSSNTVSVIDPATNTHLGTLALGKPRPNVFAPIYYDQINVHGLGFSPDGRLLAAINVTTNSVTLIRTATNDVIGTVYVGRAPHEGFFRPDGRELWVVIRGEDYVSVIDPARAMEVRRVKTMLGPGMVLFSPDGRYAYVNSSRVAEFDVVDTSTYQVVARVPVVSPFSPNLAVAPDGREVWLTHKDVGKVTAMDVRNPSKPTVMAVIDTGRVTNHVNFASNANGEFAYVTVGAEQKVLVFRRDAKPALVASIPTGPMPHGLWPSPDGTRLYVALEDGDAVQVIDTLANRTVTTIPSGQSPQALVYVPNAVPQGDGRAHLGRQGLGHRVEKLGLAVPRAPYDFLPSALPNGRGTMVVRDLGDVDEVIVNVEGLPADARYLVFLADAPAPPFKAAEYVAAVKTDKAGKGSVLSYAKVTPAMTAQSGRASLAHVVILAEDSKAVEPMFRAKGVAVSPVALGPFPAAGPAVLASSGSEISPSAAPRTR